MHDEFVEGHGIDEGLQCRAGRTGGRREVNLPRRGPEICSPEICHDITRFVVDHDRGNIGVIVEIGALAPGEVLEHHLDVGAQGRGYDRVLALVAGEELLGRMRRVEGKAQAALGDRFLAGVAGLAAGDDAALGEDCNDAVARLAGGLREAVRPTALGRLRQADEQRRLAHGQACGFLAEPGEACCPDALEIAAIGRQGQVEFEDLLLGMVPVQLERTGDLEGLGGQGAFARLHEAGDLHGDRRCARDDACVGCQLVGGAQDGEGVDASVLAEALVFPGQQHLDVARVNVGGLYWQAPAAV